MHYKIIISWLIFLRYQFINLKWGNSNTNYFLLVNTCNINFTTIKVFDNSFGWYGGSNDLEIKVVTNID